MLEKIMEEIDDLPVITDMDDGCLLKYADVEDIIRKHMNDGWIPVQQCSPSDGETVLCTDGEYTYMVEYDADLDAGFGDMDNIIAWQPLPEPYRTEKGEK